MALINGFGAARVSLIPRLRDAGGGFLYGLLQR